jgi:hypothetical protein
MKNESRVVVGVDIGGTKVAAGLVDANGEILTRNRTPMLTAGAPSNGLAAVSTAIRGLFSDAASQNQIEAIGICAPGPLNPHTGVIINPPNLAIWHNYPLAEEMRRLYNVHVRVDNDANGARGVAIGTSFTQAWAPVSAQESFLTAAFIMEGRAPRGKAVISESTAAVRFAIVGNAAASKRWRRVRRSPDVHVRNSSRIPSRSSWKWPVANFRWSAAKWLGRLMPQAILSPKR